MTPILIWVIGTVFTLAFVHVVNERDQVENTLFEDVMIFLAWPYCLGCYIGDIYAKFDK